MGAGVAAHVNYTWLDAEFAEGFASGLPPVAVPAGARLPGVPPQQAFGVVTWTPGGFYGFSAAVEASTSAASMPTTATPPSRRRTRSAMCGPAWRRPMATSVLRSTCAVNNIADANYIGSVIVGDTNGRYFEPAPGRNWFAGIGVTAAF